MSATRLTQFLRYAQCKSTERNYLNLCQLVFRGKQIINSRLLVCEYEPDRRLVNTTASTHDKCRQNGVTSQCKFPTCARPLGTPFGQGFENTFPLASTEVKMEYWMWKKQEQQKSAVPHREPHFCAQQFLITKRDLHVTCHENSNWSETDPCDNHQATWKEKEAFTPGSFFFRVNSLYVHPRCMLSEVLSRFLGGMVNNLIYLKACVFETTYISEAGCF